MCFEGLARLSRRVWRRFVRGSREISLVPSLHRASTDALIVYSRSCKFLSRRVLSYAPIVSSIIRESSTLDVYTILTYTVVITLNFTVIMISIYRSLLGQLDYIIDSTLHLRSSFMMWYVLSPLSYASSSSLSFF